jgi:endo-1,4-beta-xylanase
LIQDTQMRSILFGIALLAANVVHVPAALAEPTTYTSALSELRAKLPSDARMINSPAIGNWQITGTTEMQTVPAPSIAGGKAISIPVKQRGANPWDIAAVMTIAEPIARGDTLFLAVQIRASAADNEAQSGVISSSKIEESAGSYTAIADTGGQVSSEWTTLYATGVASQDYAPGATHISVQIASARQTIEIGQAYAFNLGPNIDMASLPRNRTDYPGRSLDAAWRAPAQARIEKTRKADIAITVRDASGKPVPGAKVQVEMQRHAFLFGSFVGHDVSAKGTDAQKLRDVFPQLFNAATSPLYWSDWGWQQPAWRAQYIASMKYLAEHDIPWRGHPLIYPAENFVPTKLKNLANDSAAYKKAVLDHVREVTVAAAPYKPFTFDVINEPRDGEYTTSRMGIDGVAEAFRIAKAAVPGAHLYVNDYGIISGGGTNERNIAFYHDYIDKLKAAGAPLGGIGMQGHFGAVLTDPARVYQIFDDMARHGVPLQITEFDIDTRDEEAQADYTRDLLTIAFSHPSIEAFVTWGYWEGDHWKPNGAMLRRDWSPKPNYHAWRKLVFSDWWTKEELQSKADGTASLRGFLGDYKVVVTVDGNRREQSFSLPKSGANLEIIM